MRHFEAHGTGTPLGDPIEVGALQAGSLDEGPRQQPAAVAAVKTEVGHLEATNLWIPYVSLLLLTDALSGDRLLFPGVPFAKYPYPFAGCCSLTRAAEDHSAAEPPRCRRLRARAASLHGRTVFLVCDLVRTSCGLPAPFLRSSGTNFSRTSGILTHVFILCLGSVLFPPNSPLDVRCANPGHSKALAVVHLHTLNPHLTLLEDVPQARNCSRLNASLSLSLREIQFRSSPRNTSHCRRGLRGPVVCPPSALEALSRTRKLITSTSCTVAEGIPKKHMHCLASTQNPHVQTCAQRSCAVFLSFA